jgi:ADP-ribosylglycohydrolase
MFPSTSASPGPKEAPTAEQFAGCLVGQCLGDALGFIVEGRGPAACQRYVDEALRPVRLAGHRRGRFAIGQYSDDSQLARELVQSFVAHRRFDPADYAGRVAALFAEGRVVGRGRATEEAALRLAGGIPWDEAGTPAPAAGNGSAMRAAPVGLFFSGDPAAMVRAAHDQGRITHQDLRCSAGAVAIAGATALALTEPHVDPARVAARLSEWSRPFDPVLAAALERLPEWVRLPPPAASPQIAAVGVQPAYTDGWEGISPFVTGSVLWSLYAYLRHPDDYWAAVCTAIAVGGDVDTTAAMTGAISGASVGLQNIPERVARLVNDQGTWQYDELVQLAGACRALVIGDGDLGAA